MKFTPTTLAQLLRGKVVKMDDDVWIGLGSKKADPDPMVVDYTKRCVRTTSIDGLACNVVRYGMTAKEAEARGDPSWRDMDVDYTNLSSGGGFLPGQERPRPKAFFNDRIMTYEEAEEFRRAQAVVQSYGPNVSVGTQVGDSGVNSVEEVPSKEERRDSDSGQNDGVNRDQFGVDTDYWGY